MKIEIFYLNIDNNNIFYYEKYQYVVCTGHIQYILY